MDHHRRSLTSTVGTRSFWYVVAALLAIIAAAGAPSPLYVVYEQRIGLLRGGPWTAIFAVYVVGAPRGAPDRRFAVRLHRRKPVLAVAFLPRDRQPRPLPARRTSVAPGSLLARIVQGIATGGALGALGAALVDTEPPGSGLGHA